MPSAQYHADADGPSLSSSIAKALLRQSPYHAWLRHTKLNASAVADESARFDLGSAAHALLLEGNQAKICIVEADDWRTKAAKEKRDEARENGLLPILAKHNTALTRMVDAARLFIDNSELKGVFSDGKPEQSVYWEESGVKLRCRPDWLTSDRSLILDYKTTDSAAPDTFNRQIPRMGYDFQASFYQRGLAAIGHQGAQFVFLAQEIEPPYACTLHGIANSMKEIADADVEESIAIWRECMATNKWPSYPNAIHWAEATTWQMQQHEQRIQNAHAI